MIQRTKSAKPFCVALIITVVASCKVAIGFSLPQEDVGLEGWIDRLASPSPAMRKQAESAILDFGEDALSAVKAGMKNGNLETYNRCKILLEKIKANRQLRLSKVFLDPEAEDEALSQFGAWPKFQKFVGDRDVASRKLFLQVCQQLPSLFDDYQIKGEISEKSLKQSARLVLIKDRHPNATPDIQVAACLFLFNEAKKRRPDKNNLGAVEILETANFIASPECVAAMRKSEFLDKINHVIASWITDEANLQTLPENARVQLIYATSNAVLIEAIVRDYDSLSNKQKLQLIDAVAHAAEGKNAIDVAQCLAWLRPALEDDTVLASTRFRKRPAEKIQVTVRMLTEGVLASLANTANQGESQIKLDDVFGIFPLSGKGFLIIKNENERQLLSERLRVRNPAGEPVN